MPCSAPRDLAGVVPDCSGGRREGRTGGWTDGRVGGWVLACPLREVQLEPHIQPLSGPQCLPPRRGIALPALFLPRVLAGCKEPRAGLSPATRKPYPAAITANSKASSIIRAENAKPTDDWPRPRRCSRSSGVWQTRVGTVSEAKSVQETHAPPPECTPVPRCVYMGVTHPCWGWPHVSPASRRAGMWMGRRASGCRAHPHHTHTHRLSRSSCVSLGVPRDWRLCSKKVTAERRGQASGAAGLHHAVPTLQDAPSLPPRRDAGAEAPQQGPRAALSPAAQRRGPGPSGAQGPWGAAPLGLALALGRGGASLPAPVSTL